MFYHLGRYVMMLGNMFRRPENFGMYWKECIRQMYDIGWGSMLIVTIISVFIGAVSAAQFTYQLAGTFIPMYYIGYIVRDMMIIELAPTFTALVLSGKVGSNIAAEIGGMRQKEHIDAMEVMGVNTANYLLTPKVIAGITIIPMLVIFAAFIGMLGGYMAAVVFGNISDASFTKGLRSFFEPRNVNMMMIKALVFSFIIITVSFYQGYFVKGGSIELGKASTNAVVVSDVLILLADYLIVILITT